jgi:hypothetical protein
VFDIDFLLRGRHAVDIPRPLFRQGAQPEAAHVKGGLDSCFELIPEKAFDRFVPPLPVALADSPRQCLAGR